MVGRRKELVIRVLPEFSRLEFQEWLQAVSESPSLYVFSAFSTISMRRLQLLWLLPNIQPTQRWLATVLVPWLLDMPLKRIHSSCAWALWSPDWDFPRRLVCFGTTIEIVSKWLSWVSLAVWSTWKNDKTIHSTNKSTFRAKQRNN